MNDQKWDAFLNDATYAVTDLWFDATGETLNTQEKYTLNDLLESFFANQHGSAE